MKIVIARHAQVQKNLQKIDFHDAREGVLTEEGKKQAIELTKKLEFFNIKKIFVSQSPRTYQTAKYLADKLHIRPVISKNLNEVNFGIFGNLSMTEAQEKYPEVYNDRINNKFNYRLPDGESFADTGKRLSSFFSEQLDKNIDGDLLIVTHATIMKIFLVKFLAIKIEEADKVIWHNTSYLEVEWDGDIFKLIKICK